MAVLGRESNCLIIAGEKSGEDHALSFFKRLRELCPHIHFWGVGGDTLKDEGLELVYHLKDFSTWGIGEAVRRAPFYFKALKALEVRAQNRKTEYAILIDFQDFNLRLAKRLKKQGVKVLYIVAPQAWAWRPWRAKTLGRNIDTLYSILPFEKEWFASRGMDRLVSTAHPVVQHFRTQAQDFASKGREQGELKVKAWSERPIRLLLLPGSRSFEVRELLQTFIKTALKLQKTHRVEVAIVKSSSVEEKNFWPLKEFSAKEYKDTDLEEALKWGDLALAASGTVTLTCGLFGLPTVVGYRSSLANEYLFYHFVKYQGAISLTNLLCNETVFPEFVQNQATELNFSRVLLSWIDNPETYLDAHQKLQSMAQGLLDVPSDLALDLSKQLIKENHD